MSIFRTAAKLAAIVRLTYLVTQDEITEPIRSRIQMNAMGKPEGSLAERSAYLVSCYRCTSVWAAAVVLALSTFKAGRVVVNILALSQLEIITHTALNRWEEDE